MILGLIVVSGCATLKGETTAEYIDDAKIIEQVNAIVLNDPDAHFVQIEARSTRGDVVLEGFMKSRDSETRIMSQIRKVGGVKSVESLLRLEENWRVSRENKR